MQGISGISALPLSLQALVEATEYPPIQQPFMEQHTTKVVMIVDTVSPTPFALLRRAKHFQYRDDDRALQQFSEFDDPVEALTDECRRVLKNISSANDSSTTKASTSLGDASWSRFEDMGFGALDDDHDDEVDESALGRRRKPHALRATAHSKTDLGRPTTPSWADFLSSGFVDDPAKSSGMLLPPDKVLPPINMRSQSSQSGRRMTDDDSMLEPGELASINTFGLDDAFWWVWISSLAGEEPLERKAVFGRCALIETNISGGRWLVMEEVIKGAAPEPEEGAYIAEKKSRFGFSKRTRLNRSKSNAGRKTFQQQKPDHMPRIQPSPLRKSNIAPDQHARIQAAAAALQQKHHTQQESAPASPRRGRHEEDVATKTSSVFTLQPVIMSEAAPAMKWANSYDKDAIRAKYLGDNFAGKGSNPDLRLPNEKAPNQVESTNGSITPMMTAQTHVPVHPRADSYGFPSSAQAASRGGFQQDGPNDPDLPPLPQEDLRNLSSEPPAHEEPTTNQPPAPLPMTPHADAQAMNREAVEAAQVPLPNPTPMEYPRAMQRKPLPLSKQSEDNVQSPVPQSFAPGPEYSEQPLANNTDPTPETSPESKKAGGRKLTKKPGAGAFKGMFGRKKSDMPTPPEQVPNNTPNSTSAVAAARAALEARQNAQPAPPSVSQQTKANRRFSGVNKKKPLPTSSAPPARPPPPMPYMPEEAQFPAAEPSPLPSPRYPSNNYRGSQTSLSRVDTNEQRHAEHEFSTFDQGPLTDQPAFVPEDSPQLSSGFDPSARHSAEEHTHPSAAQAPTALANIQPTKAHEIAARVFSAPLVAANGEHEVPDDDDSDNSNDLTQQISPVQDRWAQIRKNAAERAAKMNSDRPSEEQSRRSRQTDRTDDGETSGEESKSPDAL